MKFNIFNNKNEEYNIDNSKIKQINAYEEYKENKNKNESSNSIKNDYNISFGIN